jgi:hypothetical protein
MSADEPSARPAPGHHAVDPNAVRELIGQDPSTQKGVKMPGLVRMNLEPCVVIDWQGYADYAKR